MTEQIEQVGLRDEVVLLAARNAACYNEADGCPRWFRWATPSFVSGKAVSLVLTAFQLLAQPTRFGHAPGSRFHQPDDRSHQVQDLNSQVHGQITSFLRKRRCQHAGLTPPTVCEFYHDPCLLGNRCSCLQIVLSRGASIELDWARGRLRTEKFQKHPMVSYAWYSHVRQFVSLFKTHRDGVLVTRKVA